ncbi:MAG: polysaccharide pyruvyl transferase family protein [Hespellia sp.]|nr:polysaccharide pyruvyl transferase family protein [Hespellia sp.]
MKLHFAETQGILVEHFNVNKIAEYTKSVLTNHDGKYETMIDDAKAYVDTLDFDSYVQVLNEYLEKEQVVFPGLDCYKWKWNDHYWTKQLPHKSAEEQYSQLRKARIQSLLPMANGIKDKIVLLDTSEGTDNVGDDIIMDYCIKACQNAIKNKEVIKIPTHIYSSESEKVARYPKILCGTNLIYTQMEESRQWSLPNDLKSYTDICLLGVGMQQINIDKPISRYSKELLRFLLSSKCLHSVRDEETKNQLDKIGIKNVINTGCATMWALTPEFCKTIPRSKSRNVLTTVTDYLPDEEQDRYMLQLLKEKYQKVYIWIQGQKDYEYLKKLVDLDGFCLIPPSVEKLDKILEMDDIDYIGTRLHAGIRSLNFRHRSLVISIDNRARAIAKDTELPILERKDIGENLSTWIEEEQETKIQIPIDKIEQWKQQFE